MDGNRTAWLEDIEIDQHVKRLVYALNSMPGVSTFASCGGHETPGPGQARKGRFYVSVHFDRNDEGWRALELITWAISATDCLKFSLLAWLSGESPETAAFSLEGKKGASPDRLAEKIEACVRTRPRLGVEAE